MFTFPRTTFFLLFFLMPLVVFGQDKKGPANYIVFGLGSPSHNDDITRYTDMFSGHFDIEGEMDLDFDWGGLGFKVTEGYHLNKYLALEGGLFFLEESNLLVNATTDTGTSQYKFRVKQWGYDLYALGKYPLRRWLTLTAKLGGKHWWSDTELLSQNITRDKVSAHALLGFGIHSEIGERLLVKVDWNKSNIDNVDVSMLSLSMGVTY